MASGAGKSAAFALLILNLFLYFIVIAIAAWAVNHGIERSREAASHLPPLARLFPIYYPFGNMATGFVIIFSLIAGVVGFTTSITGLNNVIQWNAPNLHAAAASSLVTWLLTLLAMGLACKEIDVGWTESNLDSRDYVNTAKWNSAFLHCCHPCRGRRCSRTSPDSHLIIFIARITVRGSSMVGRDFCLVLERAALLSSNEKQT